MLGTLAQCEFSMGKTLMVYDMNLREMENYEKIYTNIGKIGIFSDSDFKNLQPSPFLFKLVHNSVNTKLLSCFCYKTIIIQPY